MTLLELLSSVIITIVPLGGDLGNGDICGGDIGGIYMEGKIYVCESGENTEFYKQHEIAHLIWNKYMTTKDKETYSKAYQRDKKHGIKRFYREYGYEDMEENFCDEYAILKTKERVNIHIKKRIKIICNFLTL